MRALLIQKDVKRFTDAIDKFNVYLRNLMRQLEAMEKEFENNDIENAKKILSDLIQDTKDSIED